MGGNGWEKEKTPRWGTLQAKGKKIFQKFRKTRSHADDSTNVKDRRGTPRKRGCGGYTVMLKRVDRKYFKWK